MDMSDKAFQRSLTGLTFLVLAWIIGGSVAGLLSWIWCLIIGIVVEVVIGGVLLHYWGKAYLARG
jgi:hypothetical protein